MGSKAYSGAKPSTVNKMNDQAKKGKLPQEIYESIIFEEGGYMKADNSSAFPRSLQQIHDVRRDRKLDYDVVRKFLFIFNRSCIKTVSISFSSDPLNILRFSMATIYLWISVAVILSHFGVFNTPLKRFLFSDTVCKFCI